MSDISEEDPTHIVRILSEFRPGNFSQRKSRLSHLPTCNLFDSPKLEPNILKREACNDDSSVTFSGGKRQRLNNGMSILESSSDSHLLKAELLEAKTKIVSLETQINKLHALRMEMELIYENEKRSLIKQQDCDRIKMKDLEKQLRLSRMRELSYKDELLEFKKAAGTEKGAGEMKIMKLRRQNFSLDDKLNEIEMSSRREHMTSERQNSQLESELRDTLQELEDMRECVDKQQDRLQEVTELQMKAEKYQLELQQAQLRIKDLEYQEELNKEAIEMAKSDQQKLFKYPALEKELSLLKEEHNRLKDCVANKLLLEEMVVDLQTRQAGFEEREKELLWLQDRKKHLEEALKEWCTMAKDYCETESENVVPSMISKRIGGLQEKVLVLTSDVSQLQSKLKAKEQAFESLKLEKEKFKKQAEKQEVQHNIQTNLIRRLQKKLLLVSRERDSYRLQLDSYEKELTMTSTNPQFQQQRARIEVLEKSVDDYRNLVEKLETDLEKVQGGLGTIDMLTRLQKVECERDSLLLDKKQLQKRRDELEQQLERNSLGQGKVLHFRMNPTAEAQEKRNDDIVQLQTECNKLRERVRVLEEGQTEDVTQKVNQRLAVNNSKELEDLKTQIKSYELRQQRMVEVFKETSQEYREVCYMLFGFKMDRIQQKIYKLSSMYAEHPDDHLLFQLTSENELHLMETPFSTTLEDYIELHLQHQHSIPMFMGQVTLELFGRQTILEMPDSVVIE